jgi:hypothetical protein
MRLLGLIFSIVVVTFLTAASAMAERRLALVVGNSAYRNTPSLVNPKNDAGAMAEALKRLGFNVIRGIDLSANEMRQTVRQFAVALQSADVALFYYAGHGLQVNGQNYLVPVDAKMQSSLDLEFEATNLQVVIDLMEREAKTNLVFLDACRDNPLARTLARSLGASRSTTIGQGLARIESGIGTLIAYATEPGNVALDGDGRHSPFTEALLKHIKTPGLEVGRMLRRVRGTVLKKTKGKQVPWEHTSLVGDFYFGSSPAIVSAEPKAQLKPAAPTYDPWQVELAIWESIKQSRNQADYTNYLKKYPKGAFASWARTRVADLKREKMLAMRPTPPRAKPIPPVAPAQKMANLSPQPKVVQSAPQPTAAVPAMFLSKAEVRQAVAGNTLNFLTPQDGKNIFIYFAEDGTVAARYAEGTRTVRKVWFFNKLAMLCRTVGPDNKNHCMKVARSGEPAVLDLSNPHAGVSYQAKILKGHQLPKDAPQTIAAVPSKFLTKAEIRKIIIGNTLNFIAPRNGVDLFVYYDVDGYAYIRHADMSRTKTTQWFFEGTEMLCRYRKRKSKRCVRFAKSVDPNRLEASNTYGLRYQTTILNGRQLPE